MTIQSNMAPCPVCQQPLALRLAQGRKSGKTFIMLVCSLDGRHFRGFISDRDYIARVLAPLEEQTPSHEEGQAVDHSGSLPRRSRTNLERACGS